jgi:hypothetical protein
MAFSWGQSTFRWLIDMNLNDQENGLGLKSHQCLSCSTTFLDPRKGTGWRRKGVPYADISMARRAVERGSGASSIIVNTRSALHWTRPFCGVTIAAEDIMDENNKGPRQEWSHLCRVISRVLVPEIRLEAMVVILFLEHREAAIKMQRLSGAAFAHKEMPCQETIARTPIPLGLREGGDCVLQMTDKI